MKLNWSNLCLYEPFFLDWFPVLKKPLPVLIQTIEAPKNFVSVYFCFSFSFLSHEVYHRSFWLRSFKVTLTEAPIFCFILYCLSYFASLLEAEEYIFDEVKTHCTRPISKTSITQISLITDQEVRHEKFSQQVREVATCSSFDVHRKRCLLFDVVKYLLLSGKLTVFYDKVHSN